MRRYLADLRAGARILASREFWRAFADYYSSDAIVRRMHEWAERNRRFMK